MSMTGYAALDRAGRRWEMRSVNARGLDLRLRLPELPGLEPAARAAVAAVAARGNVALSLRLADADSGGPAGSDADALDATIATLAQVRAAAEGRGYPLAPDRATDVLAITARRARDAAPELTPDVAKADLAALAAAFAADRAREGAGLQELVAGLVDEIEVRVADAEGLAGARRDHIEAGFRSALARLRDVGLDQARVAQEVAALAVKADVTEELDRLHLHVAAARDLLAADGPVGRRLDFLTQEFNREANTLCAKSGMPAMTTIGLELKTLIDRLREQVQNVE
ncbi:DUF1732 domain-containing protein [uncultured Jannaschia sp.]|uniref:YicC family protein n=1 Tax=uncultured Jannaschia sp. TaxID=293347 RepID=UPI00261BDD8B|nr:DUF1732 domain-containing protein [uncultured Jannaschia sp.]